MKTFKILLFSLLTMLMLPIYSQTMEPDGVIRILAPEWFALKEIIHLFK